MFIIHVMKNNSFEVLYIFSNLILKNLSQVVFDSTEKVKTMTIMMRFKRTFKI